ncbi:odorant receptor 85c-like isoform X1 [Frieseomelitta varia]|uniref:odorant receptor 85c-like isoform X1 n=1 Tax=Frieseomelitta varia TaxID=561572 RepID=UPI001CB69AAB|nr:odorant receptor 85c-like isoform X1 [Frieseomelitta varia]
MALKTIITYPIEVCLRLIGLWPNSSYRILQRIFWTIVMGTCVTFQIWYCITYFKTVDLPDLLDGLSVTLSNTITFIKLIILWFNYRKLRNILLVVFEDWNNCALTDQNKEFMTDNLVTCSRISKFLVVIYSMTCILYSASTMLLSDDIGELNSNNKKLLLKMRFPFDVMIFPLYEFITIAQFAFEYSVAFMAGMLMALSAALVLHIGSQIDIVCQELIDVSNHCEDEVSYLLKRVIIKHQRILYVSQNVKYLFLYTSLVQFISNILVMCFLGFILVNSLDTEQGPTIVAKCFPYYVAVICEAFVLCYTGEYLTSKSENINRAAYAMFWYNLNQQNSRTVLLILMGTQSPFTLTAGKFVTLCVETFANMLKVSASYISILLAMY